VAEAGRRFGLDAAGLSRAVHATTGASAFRPAVWVVECSEQLRAQLVQQLRQGWEIRAEAWPLADLGSVPEGIIVSTYFHYREVRAGLPRRLKQVHFARMHYDAGRVADMVAAAPAAAELLICNADPLLTPLILAEACAALPPARAVRAVAPADAAAALDAGAAAAVLFTPATWDALDARRRASPLAAPLPLLLDRADLADLARLLGWRVRATT
jgi:hypothetical protein